MNTQVFPSIIMRIKEFGESDLLVTFFTCDKGRLKGVAKGALRSRRRFVNCLDIFSLVNLEIGLKRNGDLYFLHSGKLINAHPGLRSDYIFLSRASYMIELTESLFPWEVKDPGMFKLLKESFHFMDEGKNLDLISIFFEAKALALGGYGINFEKCCICGRKYTGQGTAVFKREKGGIACLKCHKETAISPGIQPEAVKLLKLIQSSPLSMLTELAYRDKSIREIKSILKLHSEFRLEKRLKTSKYVE